jgi:osmotically inducible protein OsmC
MATHRAEAVWEGDLESGTGKAELKSGAVPGFDVSWKGRVEGVGGQTSPEELLAAAHASCFSMALAHGLAISNKPAQRLSVAAAVTIEETEEGWAVTKSRLKVRGVVPGLDENDWQGEVRGAAEGCPISVALAGNVDISVESAELEGG